MRIQLAEIFVDDQAKARSFYTEVLGFRVLTDAPYGETGQWLTVVSPEQPEGPELLLSPSNEAAKAFESSFRDVGKPAISFSTDDCQRDFQRLVAKGVTFVTEPTKMEYGGIDAVFEDGFGNLINLHQD
jgi:catechol 2,3-dioxygenase-like lactoylglutathione lyase family enzyme